MLLAIESHYRKDQTQYTNLRILEAGNETLITTFIVDETSGCLDPTKSTEKYSMSRDHLSMNKFAKQTEEDIKTMAGVLETMVEQAPALVAARVQGQ